MRVSRICVSQTCTRYLYLFKYVLFGSYLFRIPDTFWLKLDFLFGMLHFFFAIGVLLCGLNQLNSLVFIVVAAFHISLFQLFSGQLFSQSNPFF